MPHNDIPVILMERLSTNHLRATEWVCVTLVQDSHAPIGNLPETGETLRIRILSKQTHQHTTNNTNNTNRINSRKTYIITPQNSSVFRTAHTRTSPLSRPVGRLPLDTVQILNTV